MPLESRITGRSVFLGVPIDALTIDQTISRIDKAITGRQSLHHAAINVAKLVYLQKSEGLRRDVVESDLISVDGMGVIWGARLCGLKIPERVSGIDLFMRVLELCDENGYRCYFFGAHEKVLPSAIKKIRNLFPNLVIAGFRNGYFSRDEEPEIVEGINKSKVDCLFVGISTPIKERFLWQYKNQLNVSFRMGVGGSFDVLSGKTKRAPKWMQRLGLEWMFRILQEPRRMWKRYLITNSIYCIIVLREFYRIKRQALF